MILRETRDNDYKPNLVFIVCFFYLSQAFLKCVKLKGSATLEIESQKNFARVNHVFQRNDEIMQRERNIHVKNVITDTHAHSILEYFIENEETQPTTEACERRFHMQR